MHARLMNRPLLFALLAGTVVSIVIFAASHRMTIPQIAQDAPSVYSRLKMAATAGRVAAVAGSPMTAEVAAAQVAAIPPPQFKSIVPPPRSSRGPSQLIRTATLSVEVTDVTKALRAAMAITEGQLGDVIGLNDETPSSPTDVHAGTMSIRVPQYRFEQTLDALGALGKVKSKSVNAQDVSDQLVDSRARLRNLRRTEADILAIMDRSGNIEQVLSVTQQLSSVREQIEQLDAQIQGMQYQVAYSTINLTFTSPVVVNTPVGFGILGDAWKTALGSLRDFTVSLLSIGLWVVAFSPYIVILALIVRFTMHRIRSQALTTRGG